MSTRTESGDGTRSTGAGTIPVRHLRTGHALTEVGLGGAQLGNLFRARSDEQADAIVVGALGAGVGYFDTAPHYGLGLSERRLGAALRRSGQPVVVSTKVGRLLTATPERAALRDDEGFDVPAAFRRDWDFSRDGVLRSIEASLNRSGLDHVDIAYLHDPDDHWDEASSSGVEALVELRDQGVLGAVGAGMNQAAMLTRFVERTDVDVVMLAGRLTLVDHDSARPLLDAAARRGVGVVAAGVYNSGLLSESTVREDASFDYHRASADVVRRARAVSDVCRVHGVPLPVAAVHYPLRHPAVVSAVLGADSPAQVSEGIDRYRTPVPDDLWRELDSSGLVPDLTDPDPDPGGELPA